MQKRVVYNFNAQTATESAAKNSTGKAVKASNAIGKIKRAFSGKSIKLAVLVVLLFVSLFCTIGSADWIISQQKNVPNSQDGSANATFKFDDLGLNNHIDIPNVAFSGNPAQANFLKTAPNSGRDLPDEVEQSIKQSIKYKVKPYNQTSAQSRVSRAPKNAAASTAKNMAPAAYANETLPDEKFFDDSEWTNKLPTEAGTYAVLIISKVGNVSYGKAIKVFTIAPCPVRIVWSGNQGFTYDGTAHPITATAYKADENGTPIENILSISLTYKEPGADSTAATPVTEVKNAGTYTATASITNKNYVIASGSQTSFGIAKLQVNLTGVITRNYISGGYTINKDLFNGANDPNNTNSKVVCYFTAVDSAYSGVDLSGVYNDISFSSSSSAKNFGNANGLAETPENGLFSYKFGKPIKAGSTYLISGVQLNSNSNFELKNNSIYYKYQTAKIGTGTNATFFTIEDALAQSETITLCGGANGDSSYVITAFAKLSPLTGDDFKNYKSDYKYTLSGKKLIVPFDGENATEVSYNKDSYSAGNVNSALILNTAICLTLSDNAQLIAGAAIAYSQSSGSSTAAMNRGVIMNNGIITVASSCKVMAYGYIKGSETGQIILENGATAFDALAIYDWPGGSAASSMYKNVFPSNAYTMHNISCYTKIMAGAIYTAKVYVYMKKSFLEKEVNVEQIIVGTQSEKGLFNVSNNLSAMSEEQKANTYIEKSVTCYNSEINTKITSTNQRAQDSTNNKKLNHRDNIKIYGDYSDNSMAISIEVPVLGTVTLKNDKNKPLPIGFMDVTICSGIMSLTQSDYLILPGAKLTVNNGGTLTLGNDVDLVALPYSSAPTTGGVRYTQYYTANTDGNGKKDGKLIVNGTLNGSGYNLGGSISTEEAGATLNIVNASGSYVMMYHTDSPYYVSGTVNALGNIQTSNSTFSADMNMSAGTYYSRILNDHIVWYSSIATISFDTNSTTTISPKTGIAIGINGYTISASDLSSEPTKEHYSFAGWYFDKDLTTEALGQTIFASCTLYAKWTPITYSITYVIEYDEGAISSGNVINNNPTSYTIESNFYLSIPKDGDLKFICWYEDAGHNSEITQIINKGGNLTLYGVFYDSSLVVFTVEYVTNNSDYEIAAQNIKSTEANSFRPEDLSLKNNDKTYAYRFEGWYTSPDFTENSKFTELSSSCILYGKWVEKIHLDVSIDGSEYLTVRYLNPGDNGTVPQVEERTGYRTNIQAIAGCVIADGKYTVNEDATIVKIAITYIKLYSITLSINNATIIINGKSYSASTTIKDIAVANETITYSITFTESDSRTFTIKAGTTNIANGTANTANATFLMPEADVTIQASSTASCLIEGTLITLADGTKKKVEDLTYNDKVLVFNHETGKVEASTLLVNFHSDQIVPVEKKVINLKFSNGNIIGIVWEHGFFEVNLRKYVYIDESNVNNYLGHSFYSGKYVNGEFISEIVTLDSYTITTKAVRIFSPTTVWHFNIFAEDMLSMPADINGVFGIFDLDENFKYDEKAMQADIEKYGLYTYDDWKDIIPYEVYEAIPFKYFKVAIGKGYITYDEILRLYNEYIVPHLNQPETQ